MRSRTAPFNNANAARPGFALILVLSFVLSVVFILAWAGRLLPTIGVTGEPTDLFPGFTAEAAASPSHGLVVTSLRSGSEAASSGVTVGDNIVAIDGRRIESLDQARHYLHNDVQPALLIELVHDRQQRQVSLARGAGGAHGT